MLKILVVEDDEQLLFIIAKFLENSGFEVLIAHNGVEALFILQKNTDISLVIADLVMPEMDGVELCSKIRNSQFLKNIPILILTGQADIYNKSLSFNAGADDYLIKPVEFFEFMLRINALLRRVKKQETKEKTNFLNFEIDKKNSKLIIEGREIYLTMTEFKIITYLQEKSPEPVPATELLTKILGSEKGNQVTIRNHIKNIRNKIELDPNFPNFIKIIPKRGYIFNF